MPRKQNNTSSRRRARGAVRDSGRDVRVGVAGWSIPSRYKDELPGAGSHLQRYSQRLNAVEINSSFYRHHRVQTYARWADSVPASFLFSVKIPKALTHEGELHAHADVLDRFVDEVGGLGDKLAVLLVQLPPKLEFDRRAASRFFKAVQRRIDVPLACEPRHPSWGSKSANSMLSDLSVARVAADPPLWPGGDGPGGWQGLCYFRWHGQPRKYYSEYGADCLTKLEAEVIASQAKQVWAIFDNTAHGYGLGNAIEVADAIARRP